MSFQDFIGNRKAVESVRQMLSSGRIPSALLFSGPEGVGKLTLARMFAQALQCEKEKDDFCGECRGCRRTAEMFELAEQDWERRRGIKSATRRTEDLIYFDVQLIEPVSQFILTPQINSAVRTAYTKPFEFRRRVFILNDAQKIHWSGVDRLLKALEEPPPTTLFILICPNAYALRATVRSRCTRVGFLAMEEGEMENVLRRETEWSASERRLVVRLSGGSLGRARRFDLDDYRRRRQDWVTFLEGCLSGNDWSRLFEVTERFGKDRENLEENLILGYTLLRDLMILRTSGEEGRITNLDLAAQLRRWGGQVELPWIERVTRALDKSHREQVRNLNQQLALDALAAELTGAGNA